MFHFTKYQLFYWLIADHVIFEIIKKNLKHTQNQQKNNEV